MKSMEMSIMTECNDIDKCICWHGNDENLRKCIERNKFVQQIRNELMKKRYNKIFSKKSYCSKIKSG